MFAYIHEYGASKAGISLKDLGFYYPSNFDISGSPLSKKKPWGLKYDGDYTIKKKKVANEEVEDLSSISVAGKPGYIPPYVEVYPPTHLSCWRRMPTMPSTSDESVGDDPTEAPGDLQLNLKRPHFRRPTFHYRHERFGNGKERFTSHLSRLPGPKVQYSRLTQHVEGGCGTTQARCESKAQDRERRILRQAQEQESEQLEIASSSSRKRRRLTLDLDSDLNDGLAEAEKLAGKKGLQRTALAMIRTLKTELQDQKNLTDDAKLDVMEANKNAAKANKLDRMLTRVAKSRDFYKNLLGDVMKQSKVASVFLEASLQNADESFACEEGLDEYDSDYEYDVDDNFVGPRLDSLASKNRLIEFIEGVLDEKGEELHTEFATGEVAKLHG